MTKLERVLAGVALLALAIFGAALGADDETLREISQVVHTDASR